MIFGNVLISKSRFKFPCQPSWATPGSLSLPRISMLAGLSKIRLTDQKKYAWSRPSLA